MGIPAKKPAAVTLRLMVSNVLAHRATQPILDLERRLNAVEHALRRPAIAPDLTAALLEMRALLRCEMDAKPFSPRVAHRCEQRLRWIERQMPDAAARTGLLERVRHALASILPTPMAPV